MSVLFTFSHSIIMSLHSKEGLRAWLIFGRVPFSQALVNHGGKLGWNPKREKEEKKKKLKITVRKSKTTLFERMTGQSRYFGERYRVHSAYDRFCLFCSTRAIGNRKKQSRMAKITSKRRRRRAARSQSCCCCPLPRPTCPHCHFPWGCSQPVWTAN